MVSNVVDNKGKKKESIPSFGYHNRDLDWQRKSGVLTVRVVQPDVKFIPGTARDDSLECAALFL